MVKTELYFGKNIPTTNKTVSDYAFENFVNEHITPKFPDGLTILHGSGQFRMADGNIVSEPSVIIVLLHEGGHDNDARISRIRDEYKEMFSQESVLRVDYQVSVSF